MSAYAANNLGTHFLDAPLPHAENAYVGFASAVKAAVKIPVIVKLTPQVEDVVEIARAVKDAGASGLTIMAWPAREA